MSHGRPKTPACCSENNRHPLRLGTGKIGLHVAIMATLIKEEEVHPKRQLLFSETEVKKAQHTFQ